MIEIQTSTEIAVPSVAVCPAGNICLYMPAAWDVNEALAHCQHELLDVLHSRFKELFAEREFPRVFRISGERVAIKPDLSHFPNSEDYFDRFFAT